MIVARGWGRAEDWIGAIVAYGYGRLQLIVAPEEYVLHGDRTQAIVLDELEFVFESGLREAGVASGKTALLVSTGARRSNDSSGKQTITVLGTRGLVSGIGRRQLTVLPSTRRTAGNTGKTDATE